jgi:hypothetical protein
MSGDPLDVSRKANLEEGERYPLSAQDRGNTYEQDVATPTIIHKGTYS